MKVSSLTIEMAANVARLQKDMDQARRVVESTMGRVSATASIAAKALGLLGVAGGVSGLVSMARNVGQTAREIERLSAVANADAQTLQKWGYATQTVGMNQEKLSDVLKDVTDKVGEFLSTGGGPMKDFFEQIAPKVGVSADMFRKLSGPESLQLYVSSLEKAGVGQKQATFYMEALANDATALLPLLKNNGAAMNALASEAVNMGLVMSNEAREQAKELARQSEILDAQMQGVRTTIASELLPVTLEIARQFVSLNGNSRSLASTVGGMLRDSLRSVYSAGVGVVTVFHTAGKVVGGVMALLSTNISAMVQVASRVIKGDFRGAWEAATAAAASGKSIMVGIADDVSAMWVDSGAKINGVWAETAKVAASGSQSMEDSSRRGAQASKEAARAAAAELKAQRALYADLLGVSADYVEQLARIQTMRLSGALTDEQANEAATRLIERQREAGAIMEQNARWMEESAKANESAYEEQAKRVEALQEELKAQLQANEAMGLSATALAELEAARQRDTAAELERRAAMMDGIDPSIAKLYREQAKSLNELAAARVAGATKQVAVEAEKKAEEAWKATTDQISQGLTDALMRGFEDGKSFGQNFADSLENMLKTQIARALQQAIAQGLSSLFGFGGNGGGALGMTNNASSLMQMFSGGGSNFGAVSGWATGGMSTANALGSIYANTATAGLATGSIAASGAGIDALLATNAAYGTAATGAASGMAGASSAISAIPVWGWVAIAGMALWEPLFGRKLKEVGTQINFREGDISTNDYKFEKGGWFRSDKTTMLGDTTAANKQLVQQAENIQESAKGMARALGFGADAIDSFSGTVNVNMKGVKSNEEAAQRYNEALMELQRQMLNAATGAEFTKEQFADFMAGIQQDMAAVGISAEGIADILVQGMMGKLSQQEVGDALADMMVGGIYESIAQNYAGQIAQAFTGQILTPIFTAIAAGVPLSQAISQQAISNVVATAQSAAAAMNAIFSNAEFQSAIAGIQQAIGGVAGAVTKVKLPKIGSVRGAASGPSPAQIEADRIAKEREGLERQLLQLQGDTVELRRRELQELAPANRALQERIWALEEEQRITQERSGLEQQLLQLQGDTTALRQLELDALDPSNRSLQERIWALEEEQRVIDERAGLQDQLNRLTLTSTQLRALELEALDPSNRALQERIWMLEDEARVAEERNGLMSTLWQMTDNVQALREKELEALDPANRALQEMIYALGDLQNAAAEAAQKTQQAWSDWGTAAALGATHLGDTSGLQALDAIVRAQISASRDPSERLAKLQELIGIEQAVWQAQQKARQDEAKALGLRQQALQQEISQAQDLLRAAKSLGDYVRNLRLGDASGLSEMDRRDALQGEYSRLLGKARGGDAEALSQLQSVSGSYLGLSQTLATSGADYSVLAGRVAAELEAVAKAQELVAQSGITAREDEIAQLTQQSELLSAQVELSDATKALITKSMIDQADVWERENNQALELLDKQAASVDALLTMPNKFGNVLGPIITSAASNVASRIEAALAALAGPKDSESEGTVPRYAVGTNYVPRAHLAIVDEGEAIIPKAFNPWAGGQGLQGSNAELVAEVRALREQNARLESRLEAIAQSTGQMADQFDNVSAGGNALAVESM